MMTSSKKESRFSRLLHFDEILRICIKGIVYPKMKVLSLITHPHVAPNP